MKYDKEYRDKVERAKLNGKEIEWGWHEGEWRDCGSMPNTWDWDTYDYRIKGEKVENTEIKYEDTLAQIEVMKALTDGKEIEFRARSNLGTIVAGKWCNAYVPLWDWHHCEYRIKEIVPLDCPFCGFCVTISGTPSCWNCRCSNSFCISLGIETKYVTSDKAIEAWNKRI